jgi:hypothetical protein
MTVAAPGAWSSKLASAAAIPAGSARACTTCAQPCQRAADEPGGPVAHEAVADAYTGLEHERLQLEYAGLAVRLSVDPWAARCRTRATATDKIGSVIQPF